MARRIEEVFLRKHRAPLHRNTRLLQLLPSKVSKLQGFREDYDQILKAMGNSKVVMLGEASHGTHEFYKTRVEITKRLIMERDFHFVAIEGDWPDVYRANRYVCGVGGGESAEESLGDFTRFPRWMWRNTVMKEFVEWLRNYNQPKPLNERVRIYGLDLYSMFRSADKVIEYLDKVDQHAATIARHRYGTLNRYRNDEFKYAEEVAMKLAPSREKEVVAMLTHMLSKGEEYMKRQGGFIDGDELFFAQINAKVVKDAEEYYRHAFSGGTVTWNLRDKHMCETMEALLEYHQKKRNKSSSGVIWAHNSHLGDSRATEYAKETGEYNIGQLIRERIGKANSFNVGFTSYTGSVLAANSWGGAAQKFELTPAFEDSYEAVFHQAKPENWSLILRSNNDAIKPDPDLLTELKQTRTERMVGVQYIKKSERQSHYVPAILPDQFDSVIHFDITNALQPLDPLTSQ